MSTSRIAPHIHLTFASIYGIVGFALALAVHASTFTTSSLSPTHPLFWGLHIGIFPLFIPMVFRLQKWSTQREGALEFRTAELRWRELLAHLPKVAIGIGALLFAYAMINFFLAMSHTSGVSHVSAAAASQLSAEQARYTVRAFSGHWLVFYAMPTLFYLFVPPSAKPLPEE